MRTVVWTLLTLVVVLAGCDSTGPNSLGNVQVSFATQGARQQPVEAAAPVMWGFQDDTIAAGADTIILTSVEIVVRELELQRIDGGGDCDDDDSDDDNDGDSDGDDGSDSDDDCEELELGPFLVALPLDGSVSTEIDVDLPAGTYSEIELEIHKPDDDDPEDAEFLADHPDFVDVSIRVQGTYNGQSFEFETDLNVEQELQLSPPFVVMDEEEKNVTIFVALDTWFLASGGSLYDPATGNQGGANESAIRQNIVESFEAFEDDDRDGEEDDDDNDGDG